MQSWPSCLLCAVRTTGLSAVSTRDESLVPHKEDTQIQNKPLSLQLDSLHLT